MVETPLNISLAMVDRFSVAEPRVGSAHRLNEVEISLMDDVTSIIGSEWANLWKDFKDIQSSIVSHENSPQYLSAFFLMPPQMAGDRYQTGRDRSHTVRSSRA